jgi:hypothetical protein
MILQAIAGLVKTRNEAFVGEVGPPNRGRKSYHDRCANIWDTIYV